MCPRLTHLSPRAAPTPKPSDVIIGPSAWPKNNAQRRLIASDFNLGEDRNNITPWVTCPTPTPEVNGRGAENSMIGSGGHFLDQRPHHCTSIIIIIIID